MVHNDATIRDIESVLQCTQCSGEQSGTLWVKVGRDRQPRQLYQCNACGRRITARSCSTFSRHHFPDDIIAFAIRWDLRYRLSHAEVTEWLAERGISVELNTIYDWVRAFAPLAGSAA